MSTGLPVFDNTIQETNHWLHLVEARLPPCDRHQAYTAMRAVLHALRDRLPAQAVMGLSEQLPMLVRGFFLAGWRPTAGPSDIRTPEAFADEVAADLPPAFPRAADEVVRAVLSVVAERVDPGEVAKIVAHLPLPLHRFWPVEHRAA